MHVRNVHIKNSVHTMAANWASSAAVNLEQREVPANTTSTSLLPLSLNHACINSSRSILDEKYVTPKF